MNLTGIMIGGIVPAICLGLGTVLMSASIGAGASIPVYLASVDTIIAFIGWAWAAANDFAGSTMLGIVFAVGMAWSGRSPSVAWPMASAC